MLFSRINSKIGIIILMGFFVGSLLLIRNSFLAVDREINDLILNQTVIGSAQLRRSSSKVNYIINFGEDNIVEEQLFLLKDSTVFSLLQDLVQKRNFKIETSHYEGMGVLVESIDGVQNGIDDKYWQYWVNDELPMVSADNTQVEKEDIIEWRFESIAF